MQSNIELIVNADDFGYSSVVNEAIVKSFDQYLINSTSLITNMPGFEDALERLSTHPFLANRVGLHLNITEGFPITQAIRSFSRFCDQDGRLRYDRSKPLFFLNGAEQRVLYDEFSAQMEKLTDAGIGPIHIDSHYHIHTEWAVLPLVIRLCQEYKVPRIRLTRNMGKQHGSVRKLYRQIFNKRLKKLPGFNHTDYFGDIDDLAILIREKEVEGKSVEVMVHPCLNAQGDIVDQDQQILRSKLNRVIDPKLFISFTDF